VGVLDASTSPPKKRYAVSKDNIIKLIRPGNVYDQLTEILRNARLGQQSTRPPSAGMVGLTNTPRGSGAICQRSATSTSGPMASISKHASKTKSSASWC
jgi:hypothetical protein